MTRPPQPLSGKIKSLQGIRYDLSAFFLDEFIAGIFCSFFHFMKSQNQFQSSLRPFLLSNFYLEIRRLVSLLASYKVHKPPKNLYLLTWAGTKMSYCYFLLIFSWYVKPELISEKFETIFVKHFLP